MFDYQEECRRLVKYISIGDFQEARIRCDILFEKICQSNRTSADYIRHILFYLQDRLYEYGLARHIIREQGPDLPEYAVRDLDNFSKATKDIRSLLEQIIRSQVCLETGQKASHETVQDAQAYILEHYRDENLSLPMIAEQLMVSPAYLSKLFSSNLGMSISEYISRLRIQYAKTLLSGKDPVRVEQAAASSGFFTVQTFIRTFKKYENMTPGAYQSRARRKNPVLHS
ncbi:MAG: helix-turn-helix transcriptional regulator [Lachnospiraceae bacterium]|nr:helix-turn-helix transcriptional regulator [Lachnospiraceae bacterium]